MDASHTDVIIPSASMHKPPEQRINRYSVSYRARATSLPPSTHPIPVVALPSATQEARVVPRHQFVSAFQVSPPPPLRIRNRPPAFDYHPSRALASPRQPRRRLRSEGTRRPSPLRHSVTAESLHQELDDETRTTLHMHASGKPSTASLPPTPICSRTSSPAPPLPPKDHNLKHPIDVSWSVHVTRYEERRPRIKLDDCDQKVISDSEGEVNERGRKKDRKRGRKLSKPRKPEKNPPPYSDDGFDSSGAMFCIPTARRPSPSSPSSSRISQLFERPAKSTPNVLLLRNQFSAELLPPSIPVYANRPWPGRSRAPHAQGENKAT